MAANESRSSVRDAARGKTMGFARLPSTRLGWWAGGVSLTFIVLFVFASIPALAFRVPGFGLLGIVSALLSVLALTLGRDRSWLVWLGVAVGALLLADLLKALVPGP